MGRLECTRFCRCGLERQLRWLLCRPTRPKPRTLAGVVARGRGALALVVRAGPLLAGEAREADARDAPGAAQRRRQRPQHRHPGGSAAAAWCSWVLPVAGEAPGRRGGAGRASERGEQTQSPRVDGGEAVRRAMVTAQRRTL